MIAKAQPSQYTPMTAAGYQMKRLKVDSTMHLPSFCGVPNLKNSTAKDGAVAIDTCNNALYIWTNADGWTAIVGGTVVDTAAINAAIALRVKYSDTALMLQPYLRKIDTTNKWVNSVTKLNDSTIRVVKNTVTTDLVIRGTGIKYSDTATMLAPYLRKVDTTAMLLPYLRKVDTTAMLSKYLRKIDTTAMLLPYLRKIDTTAMLSKYLRRTDTTAMLVPYLRKIDTTNRFVNNVTKKNDSTIIVFKGSTATEILLPRATGGGGSGSVTNVGTGYGLSGGPITTTGTLLVDSATLSTKYLRRNDTANLVATKSNMALKVNIADTASMLLPYLRKVDTTAMLSKYLRRTDTTAMLLPYLREIDTTAMLTPYLRKIDTTAMLTPYLREIDTTAMLSPYLRKIDTTNKFVNNVTRLNDSTIAIFKGSTATTIELNGRLNGLGTANYLPMWSSSTSLTNSTINDSANNIWFKRNGENRSWLTPLGFQFWKLNNSTTECGLIGYGTPNGLVGISFLNASLTGRSDIRHQTNGGFSFASHAAGTIPLVDQIYFNPTGNLQINQAADSGYKLLVNGDVKIADSLKLTGIENMTDTTSAKPLVIDANGQVKKSTYWPSGGGGTSNGVNGLNGTSNIGLGGTLTETNTFLDGTTNSEESLYIGFNTQLSTFYASADEFLFAAGFNDFTIDLVPNIIGPDSEFKITNLDAVVDTTVYKPLVFDSANNIVKRFKSWPKGGAATPTGYYGAFQDNTTQSAVSANTAYPVKFNTTDLTNGVSIVNDGSSNPTRVTLANTGIYNIQFSLQLEKTGGSGNMIADIWIRKNGVDIPSTTGKVVLTGSANASPVVAAWNYVLDLSQGDYIQLMWATTNTNVEIVAAGATSPHPAIPSSILTVTQQSGIMAGTGITAINSLTGAAQTIVTGTSGNDFAVTSAGSTHTLNLPTASAANTGKLSNADWTTFNNKANNDTTTFYLTSDFTTSNTTATNTNLTFNLGANEVRRIMINGTCSKVGTTGIKLAIGAPTGATIKATQNSSGNAINTAAVTVISAINTLGGTINTASGVEMPFRIEGIITNGSTAGAVTLQAATVTSGGITIYAGTILSIGRVKGL
jgi:hypothetical protein